MLNLNSLFNDWGTTVLLLAFAGLTFSIVLVFSLREFAGWFLKTQRILENQEIILKKLASLEKREALELVQAPKDNITQFPVLTLEEPKTKFHTPFQS